MNAIVLNTKNGAVTEYTNWAFDSISPNHAVSSAGVFSLGGDTDNGTVINGVFTTGKKLWGTSFKKQLQAAYFSFTGLGIGNLTVFGETRSYSYVVPPTTTGEARVMLGRGMRENYFQFSYTNPQGDAFTIDSIDIPFGTSKNRRV